MNVETKEREDSFSEDDYQEYLNDLYPLVDICGFKMQQGDILLEMDYTAFREGYNNYLDSEVEDVYTCGECNVEYTDEEEAEECCKEEENEGVELVDAKTYNEIHFPDREKRRLKKK